MPVSRPGHSAASPGRWASCPGKDGLVHISKLAEHRIEKVEDACKIGDMMWVKVTDIDEKGRVNLSHKDAVREIKAKEAKGERVK